ncbi:MAG: hypothetical protein ACFE9L_09275 [Candidatus Hodarchaeota archaeon]
MRTVSEAFVAKIYKIVSQRMRERPPGVLERWLVTEYLVEVEEYDRDEVHEALDLLQCELGWFYEPFLGKIAMVR